MTDETTPPDELEQFLSAPETLEGPELKKAKIRKAREEARTNQLANAKKYRDELPSVEDLIADMVRVAECEVTNPNWSKFRATSGQR